MGNPKGFSFFKIGVANFQIPQKKTIRGMECLVQRYPQTRVQIPAGPLNWNQMIILPYSILVIFFTHPGPDLPQHQANKRNENDCCS